MARDALANSMCLQGGTREDHRRRDDPRRPLPLRPGRTPTPASPASASPAPGATSRPPRRCVETFTRYLIGQDPLRIEHHWQYMYRSSHFRGAAIMGAISAPSTSRSGTSPASTSACRCYQLLGGKCRDKARVYYHVFGSTTRGARRQGCVDAKKRGLHRRRPPDALPRRASRGALLQDAREQDERRHRHRRQYREAVGNDVDLCVEIHRRLTPHEAIVLGRGIEQYHPFFYEDPILPGQPRRDGARSRSNIHIPIATGERIHTIWEFEMLLRARRRPVRPAGRLHVRRHHATRRRSPRWPRPATSASCRTTR